MLAIAAVLDGGEDWRADRLPICSCSYLASSGAQRRTTQSIAPSRSVGLVALFV